MRIIRGKYGRRRFDVPGNITARPTTDFARENIFNIIENLVDIEGIDAVDLFAGTGAVSLELLSRGAAHVTAVEKASTQWRFIAKVAAELREENLTIVRGDVFRFLATAQKGCADFVFADPPYDMPRFDDVLPAVMESGILRPGGYFILEHPARRRTPAGIVDVTAICARSEWFVRHVAYGSVNFSIYRTDAARIAE